MKSSKKQAVDPILSKTIAIIVGLMIATYLPVMIILIVAAFVLTNSADNYFQRVKWFYVGIDIMPNKYNT